MGREEVEAWIRARVTPAGAVEVAHERPWATVLRVPVASGQVWFKACGAVQAFEPRLTASLFERWPDRIAEVLDHDPVRGWLLLADAGTPVGEIGNPPQAWLAALPAYAELQRGESRHTVDHLSHGVPDLRIETLPECLDALLRRDLPLDVAEVARLRAFALRFGELCAELATRGIPNTIQHDDLHHKNLYEREGRARVLDWGDSSISHPFASLVVTFRFLEEITKLPPNDPWFVRLRDAYLEPWGERPRRELRARIPRGHVRARVRLGTTARPPSTRGARPVRHALRERAPTRARVRRHQGTFVNAGPAERR